MPLTAADVKIYDAQTPLYDPTALRTLFLTFESSDWEKELEDFHHTDVEVPVTLTVDGKTYRDVGVHFRGASSYMMVRAGSKRSLNLSLDDVHSAQNLLGHRTLNLLNSHGDASFLRPVLFSAIAQNYLPSPRVNFVRVVINGENWSIYANAEQFNKDFVHDRLKSAKGARWKVPGSPAGRGNLDYLGDDPLPTAPSTKSSPRTTRNPGRSSSASPRPSATRPPTNSQPPSPRSSTSTPPSASSPSMSPS